MRRIDVEVGVTKPVYKYGTDIHLKERKLAINQFVSNVSSLCAMGCVSTYYNMSSKMEHCVYVRVPSPHHI